MSGWVMKMKCSGSVPSQDMSVADSTIGGVAALDKYALLPLVHLTRYLTVFVHLTFSVDIPDSYLILEVL